MTKLEKIEQDFRALSPKEQRKFVDLILELDNEAWDRQIEEDVKAGKLDKLMDEALADHRAGLTKPL